MLFLKNVLGLVSSVLGFFICLVYRNTISVYAATNMINDKIYDAHIITLGDYSVQGQISHTMYNKFIDNLTAKGINKEENGV